MEGEVMAITIRPDDPPKDNSWMEESAPDEPTKPRVLPSNQRFYPGTLEGSTEITDPVMRQLSSEGKAQIRMADIMRQKYGPRADEVMTRLNELRKQNKLSPTDWNRAVRMSRGGGSAYGMDTDGKEIKVGSKFDFTQPDSFAALLSHEVAHQQDPTSAGAQLPAGFSTSHNRDPKSLREANAFILGDQLAAYNMAQTDENKFHPAIYKNPDTGEYDFDAGMKEFTRIMDKNPGLFPDWGTLQGTLDSNSPSGKAFRKASQSIGANRVTSTPTSYQIRPDQEMA